MNVKQKMAAFWNAVKPFISDDVKGGQEIVILNHNGHILNEPQRVSNAFNACSNNIQIGVGNDTRYIIRFTVSKMSTLRSI